MIDQIETQETDDVFAIDSTVAQKLADLALPGFVVAFSENEARRAGAFVEDALSEKDAADAAFGDLDVDVDNE